MKLMSKLLIFGFLILRLQPIEAQTLTSWMRGTAANTHILSLKYAGPSTWILSDYTPCAKYPCDIKNQSTETRLMARWNSSQLAADGNTEIGLSNGMVVTYINNGMVPPNPDGTRAESYWMLEIPAAHGRAAELIRLQFLPSIE